MLGGAGVSTTPSPPFPFSLQKAYELLQLIFFPIVINYSALSRKKDQSQICLKSELQSFFFK